MQPSESSGFSSRLSRIKNSCKQGAKDTRRSSTPSLLAGFLIKVSTAKQAFLLIRLIEESERMGVVTVVGDLKDREFI